MLPIQTHVLPFKRSKLVFDLLRDPTFYYNMVCEGERGGEGGREG